jgi:RNA polymerase sigma-54 factor
MRFEQQMHLAADQRVSQNTMLLPAMQQALAILQVPIQELTPILREALEANPLWEVDEPQDQRMDWSTPPEQPAGSWEESFAQPTSARQQVAQEICLHFMRELDQVRALRLLEELNTEGLLEGPEASYAELLGCSEDELHHLVQECQKLDPPGIFAQNPQQALLLQMERLGRASTLGYRILQDHYEPLLHLRLKELCRTLGLSEPELLAALKTDLRGLRRGRVFEDPANFHLLVDATILYEAGNWVIEIHDERLPSIRLQPCYVAHLSSPNGCSDRSGLTEYLEGRLREGMFLKKALDQRSRTLRRILEAVIPLQEAFLTSATAAAQELTMSHVAQQLQLSESTLSRAVSNKWLGTPRGLVPLRALFVAPGAVQSSLVGVDLSTTLRRLIEQEPSHEPFSDVQLAEKMHAAGFPMARRTVAKYRSSLGIPGQKERRWSKS